MSSGRIERNRKWWTLAAVTASLFMVMVDTTIVNVALPSIQADLKLNISRLEWTVNAFLLVYAAFLLSGGKLADFLGRRRLFLVGLAIFTASSLACGAAPSGGFLIAARAVQGLGAALMLPATHGLIAANFRHEERGMAYGIWAGVSMLGLSLGPLVGGLLVDSLSWRWIFYVNIPFGTAAFLFAAVVVRESKDTSAEQRLDLVGLVSAGVALFALVFGLIESNRHGWTSATIVGAFVAAAVALGVFVLAELRQKRPMLDLSFFRNRTFAGANVAALLIMFAMLGFLFFMSLYLQAVLGYSAIRAGATFLPTTLLMMATAPAAGKLSDVVGARWLVASGMSLFAVALLLLSRLDASSSFGDMLPGLAIGGVGVGLSTSPTTMAAISSLPVEKAGVASGVLNTFRQTGGALGIAIMGAILASSLGNKAPGAPGFKHGFVPGFQDALRLTALVCFAGALFAAIMIRKVGPAEEPEEPEALPGVAAPLPAAALDGGRSAATPAPTPAPAPAHLAEEPTVERLPALVFARGALAGQRHEIASEVSIGREGADLTLEDAEVSRRHAVIRPTGDSVEISDLGSANGTFVNGERIRDARLLEDGDVVRIGQTSLFVEVPLPPGRAMPTVMTPMLGRPALVVASGSLAGERFEIDSELSLGREGTDIVLDDREVSRRHGIVRPADGAAEIADLGSANGTFVNGERISAARRLVDGDIVRIGQTLLNFELSAPLSGSSATVIRRAPDAGQVNS